MDFAFLEPSNDLKPWVIGFAQRRDIRPLGSALELPLQHPLLQFLTASAYVLRPVDGVGGFERAPSAGLWGPTTTSFQAHHEGALQAFVVILTHSGFRRLTGFMPGELLNRRVALSEACPHAAGIEARLSALHGFREKALFASAWLRSISDEVSCRDATLLRMVDAILSANEPVRVSALAQRLGISLRTLHKTFVAASGQGPKQVMRIARLGRALRTLHPHPWGGKRHSDPAADYFDQAHFCRDFKELTSVSPTQYRKSKISLGDPLVNTLYTDYGLAVTKAIE
ncbi:MAG TPA: AraC family transcriptional regulator [Pseudoxanthomonas sp.]